MVCKSSREIETSPKRKREMLRAGIMVGGGMAAIFNIHGAHVEEGLVWSVWLEENEVRIIRSIF